MQLIRKLNSDLESNIHNISYNKKRVNDDGSSTNSDKKINIIENSEDNISSNKDNLGDNYIDNSDQSSLNEVKNNIKQNKLFMITLNYSRDNTDYFINHLWNKITRLESENIIILKLSKKYL